MAIAAAMVHDPPLLVLDEPTSQLDPVAGDELVWQLRRLNEDWGTAVVVAEHRLERCLPAADRVIAMVDGAVACDAAPREFLDWAAAQSPPALATPAARLFSLAGLRPLPASVKEAHAAARSRERPVTVDLPATCAAKTRTRFRSGRGSAALYCVVTVAALNPRSSQGGVARGRGRAHDPARHLAASSSPGERVALMGRNGAGKSTLLRHREGARASPRAGSVERAGEVALLLQNPGDYLVHGHAVEDAGVAGVAAAGLAGREEANPRDLSGGERQRLALEVVLGGRTPRRSASSCLDEPTRGMDRDPQGRARRADRAARGGRRRGDGRDARHRVRRLPRQPDRAARAGRRDRRRAARGGPRRRQAFLDRGGPRDERSGAAAGGGRGDPARAPRCLQCSARSAAGRRSRR